MRRKRRRGISLGTIVILIWTALVVGATMMVLPRLSGDTAVELNAGTMLQALSLLDDLPELSLSDIPIAGTTAAQMTAAPAGASAPEQTLPPAVTPQPTQEPVQPEPTAVPGGSFTLTIGGSVNLDEAVRKSGYYSESEKYDFAELFSLIQDEWTGDVTLLSMENLVIPDKKVSALNAPSAILTALRSAGVDVLALGFPKAFDQKLDGVTATLTAAEENALQVIGLYGSEGQQGLIREVNGVQVGFLHYTQSLSTTGAKAIKNAKASYAVPLLSGEQAASDIAALRSAGAQAIIVSVNWDGSKSTPTAKQKELAQQLANAGADVIVGSGTGIVQPAVWLEANRSDGTTQQVLCAYSLGSIINAERNNGDVASLLLHLSITVDGSGHAAVTQATYTPTYIWRYKQDGKYYYRVVASDQPAPDGMGSDQTEVKERALTNVQKYLGTDSALTLRTK